MSEHEDTGVGDCDQPGASRIGKVKPSRHRAILRRRLRWLQKRMTSERGETRRWLVQEAEAIKWALEELGRSSSTDEDLGAYPGAGTP